MSRLSDLGAERVSGGTADRPNRLALVLADCRAVPPPGIDSQAFAAACLADSYEVLSDLDQVRAGIAFRVDLGSPSGPGPHAPTESEIEELLWPGDLSVPVPGPGLRGVVAAAGALTDSGSGPFTELILVPADVPDLPGLVPAKIAKALHRADVCLAPELGGPGLAAIGFRLPRPGWLDGGPDPDFDLDPTEELRALAPRPAAVDRVAGWHRLRSPTSVGRLDPGLEGWEQVRLLLGG